jgi:HK97 family phage major capsid protein
MDFLKSFGGAVKAVAPFTIKGRGVVYGGADLTGDTFTRATDFGESRPFIGMPVYYDHALGSMRGQIGTVKSWQPADDGIDVEIEIDRRNRYAAEVMKLVKSGALGLSTGALSHLVVREDGELKRWVVGEISLTPTPAEPRTMTNEVKASQDCTARTAADASHGTDDTSDITQQGFTVDIQDQIKDAVKAALIEAAGEKVEGGVIAAPATKTVTTRGFSDEPWHALKHYLKTGDRIAAKTTLAEGSNNTGGFLVPVDLYNEIIGRRDEMSLLGAFNIRRIKTNERQIVVPGQSTKSSFAIVAESGSANFSEPNFANSKTITVYKYSLAMKVTSELLNDEQTNLQQFLSADIARAYAVAVNDAIINGTGSSQPYGILTRTTQNVTAASATAVTFGEVVSLEYNIPAAYVEGAGPTDVGFLMANASLGKVRALTGNYPQFGGINRDAVGGQGVIREIDGFRAFASTSMPAMTTGLKSMAFGNFNYYSFVENGSLEIKRNDQLYMNTDEVAFFCYVRFGGDLIQPEAFTTLTQA